MKILCRFLEHKWMDICDCGMLICESRVCIAHNDDKHHYNGKVICIRCLTYKE